jgi:hypothetical protein
MGNLTHQPGVADIGMGFALSQINVRLGFRLGFQATGPRDAVLGGLPRNAARSRIHGGIKARENNVEEA